MSPLTSVLVEIKNFLTLKGVTLSKTFSDGRINASLNEQEVIKLIKRKFPITLPRDRDWYDFAIEDGGSFYPVNIKVTKTTSADNLSCKLGIYYALTGLLPDFKNEITWENYFKKLKENIGHKKNRDYYFLILNKSDTTDVFVTTLRSLNTLQPNGNNLPFQCKWDINRDMKRRTFEEARDFLLDTFWKSVELRANMYETFKHYFPEYAKQKKIT
jgi:hypothetical protein